jgi:hypothetical protein
VPHYSIPYLASSVNLKDGRKHSYACKVIADGKSHTKEFSTKFAGVPCCGP